jgi:hypothetical protein
MSHRKSCCTAILALVVPALAHAQTFEVASIKPTDPSFTLRSIQMPLNDGLVGIRGLSLKELIQYAWETSAWEPACIPIWLRVGQAGLAMTGTISWPGRRVLVYPRGPSAGRCCKGCLSRGSN